MHLFMAMALLAWFASNAASQAVVVKPVANMYAQPSEDAEVVSQAIYGSTIGVIEERSGWLRIRTADDYTGWMPGSGARRLSIGDKPYAAAGRVAQVESRVAHTYRGRDVARHQP